MQLPDSTVTKYQYEILGTEGSTHRISEVDEPDNRILRNTYDAAGRVVQQISTTGFNGITLASTATFDYSVFGQTTFRDANNNPTIYQYDANGRITQTTDPLVRTIMQVWYNNTGNGAYPNSLQQITDKRGLITTYQYDAQGNITNTQISGDLVGDGSSKTATTTATYNSLNLPLTVTDASGITTSYSYSDPSPNHKYLPTQIATSKSGTTLRTDLLTYIDQGSSAVFSNGLLATKTVASGSPDQAVTTYSYNSAGFLTQQTAQTGTADPNVVTNFTYTPRGELATVTDGDGRSTTYTYDGMSRPLTKVVKDENGNILGTWTMAYDGNGDLSQTSGPQTSPANIVQRYYDGAGNLAEEIAARSQASQNGAGVVPSPTYAITDYVYDFAGNPVWEMDPLGNETTMSYDADNQLVAKSTYQGSSSGSAPLRTESYTYEPGGKAATYTNPLGGLTRYLYTSTGQPRDQQNPDGSELKWTYYTDGRLNQEIMRNGSAWTTVYDDVLLIAH